MGNEARVRGNADTVAGLDASYMQMFLKAKQAVGTHRWGHETGIKIVLFGTFYIEAVLNRFVKDLLFKEIPSEDHAHSIWRAIEKTNIISKLSVAISSSPRHKPRMEEYLAKARRILDQRNRLVHSKDGETVWLNAAKAGKASLLSAAPHPSRMALREYVRSTESIARLINDLSLLHFKTGITVMPKKKRPRRKKTVALVEPCASPVMVD